MAAKPSTASITAFVHGILIDGSGTPPVPDSVVIVRGTTIEAAGRAAEIPLPDGAKRIDISGKTVMPGLIDAHVHLCIEPDFSVSPSPDAFLRHATDVAGTTVRVYERARRTLRAGVTTLRDVGDFNYTTLAVRDAINAGLLEGPRILVCGPALTSTGSPNDFVPDSMSVDADIMSIVDGVDEIRKAVRRHAKRNVDWIKGFATGGAVGGDQEFSDDELATLVEEAHRRARPVAVHAIQSRGMLAAVKAGADTIEHGNQLTDECIAEMVRRGTVLVPTLYTGLAVLENWAKPARKPISVESAEAEFEQSLNNLRRALQAGVAIAMGTDCGWGPCPHGMNAVELELMVRGGMTPMKSIVAATGAAAKALKLEQKVGTLTEGKAADLLVLDGDPLTDIRVLQDSCRLLLVMREGVVHTGRLGGL